MKRKIGFATLFIALILCFLYRADLNDLALNVLSQVKSLKGDQVELNTLQGKDKPPSHEVWDVLLKKYVDDKGNVSYKGFKQDKEALESYLNTLSTNPPDSSKWTVADRLAYWINSYNAFTVKLIIDYYPLKSIKDIAGNLPMINSPWDLKFFKIGDLDFDLNTIEHEILRKKFEEPRIHFAINCASISCPNLLNEAFTANKLEDQLQKRAIFFINNQNKNHITSEKLQVSNIFNWFQKDFTKKGSLQSYLNNYTEIEIDPNASIEYLEYDWNLNGY